MPATAPCSDLQCWLKSLVIHIPDQRFEVMDVTGTVTNVLCSHITLGQLTSGMVPPAGIELSATGLSIECTLNWSLKALIIQTQGSASAQVSGSSLTLGLQLQSAPPPVNSTSFTLPVGASLASCAPSIQVSSIEFQGDLDVFLNLFRTQIASIISTQLDKVICDQLSSLVQTNLTDALQEVDHFIVPFLKPRPVVPAPTPPAGMIDLRRSPLVGVTAYLLNDVIGADGPLGLNKIVDALTNGTGSVTLGPLTNVSLSIAVPSLGSVRLGLETVTLSGLNSWSLFQGIDPSTGPYNLTSHTRLERLGFSFGFSLNVTLAGGVEAGGFLYEEAVLNARMTDNALDSVLQLALDAAAIERLSNEQAIVPGCLMSTVYDVNLTQLDLSFVLAELQIVAGGANNTNHSGHGTTEQQIDEAVNHAFALLTGAYAEVLPALFNGLVAGPARELVNVGFSDEVLQANGTCTNPSAPELVNQETTTAAFSTAGGMYVALLLIVGLVEYLRWRERSADIMPLSDDSDEGDDEEAKLLTDDERKASDERKAQHQNKWQRSLLFSPRLPAVARHAVLVLLLANIALFVSATTSIGASVYVYVTLGDQVTRLPSLFDFTLARSVTDMWKAEVYPLSLMILVFSGLWPYVKLVLVLGCWVAPLHLLSHRRREQTMMALDALGKWSLIDAFVLTLTMVAFNFHIVPPVSPHTPPGTASVDAYLVPHWGFYGFMLATMLSLGVTHVVLACHRFESRCAAAAAAAANGDASSCGSGSAQAPEWKALCTHAFRATAGPCWSRLIAVALTGLLVLAIGLIGCGAAYHSFEFEFRGAFKLLLDFLHDPNVRPYSIVTTGLAIPESSPDPDELGVRFIQATWFCFAIVIPLCHQLLLLVLWLTPLTPKLQRAVFVVTEVVNAWSALDVVVVSVIVALLELQQFAQFVIGDRCALINRVLAKYFGRVLDGDALCFDVVATLDEGCWLLFTACLINIVVGLLVQLTCHKVLRQREEQLAALQQQQPAGRTQVQDKPLQVQRITIN